jgi:hypothetical protein
MRKAEKALTSKRLLEVEAALKPSVPQRRANTNRQKQAA